jgi:hypothetical protein
MSTVYARPSKAACAEKCAAQNAEAARVIAADPRYQGAMREWALSVLRGAPRSRADWRLPA